MNLILFLLLSLQNFEGYIPAAIGILLIPEDQRIYSSIKEFENKNNWISKTSPIVTRGADIGVILTISSFYLSGEKKTAELSTKAYALSGVITIVGKGFFNRERPREATKDGGKWYGPKGLLEKDKWWENVSFPSGHTSSAFAVATVIAERYKKNKLTFISAYSLATLVGLSRITQDAHWLSDVLVGASIGYLSGKYIVKNAKF